MDGGTTADGQPFFVMELVDGEPIDRYCDDQRLSIDERLDLFRKVCAGVQYAHENLVVHRDIKPDNILVTKDGVPKLLDFGVAKILSRDGAPPEDPAATAATWIDDARLRQPRADGRAAEHHGHRRLLARRAAARAAHRRAPVHARPARRRPPSRSSCSSSR